VIDYVILTPLQELTVAKLRAWLGIHFMAFAWKFPLLFRSWNSGTYTGMSIPKFSSNILRGGYENTLELEIRGLQKRRWIEANWHLEIVRGTNLNS
jgi:hypothetical protein